jgi:hypothetical protein
MKSQQRHPAWVSRQLDVNNPSNLEGRQDAQMNVHRSTAFIWILALAGLVVATACCCGGPILLLSQFPVGNDSWSHYTNGGMYATHSPSISENGKEIVFSTPATGHGDIYIAHTKTGVTRRLTSADDFESSPYFVSRTSLVVFTREQVQSCNIWSIDLHSGEERQLTKGRFNEVIVDVATTGNHLLVQRSDQLRGRTTISLVDIQSGEAMELADCFHAIFANGGRSLLATRGVDEPGVFETNLKGEATTRLADGTAIDFCDEANLAIVQRRGPPDHKTPDHDLYLLDLATKELHPIAKGARGAVFPNGKVLFTVGYECQAMIWEKDNGPPRKIDYPAGYNVGPIRSPGSPDAAFFIMPPNSPSRLYDIYRFDSKSEAFSKINVVLPAQ